MHQCPEGVSDKPRVDDFSAILIWGISSPEKALNVNFRVSGNPWSSIFRQLGEGDISGPGIMFVFQTSAQDIILVTKTRRYKR